MLQMSKFDISINANHRHPGESRDPYKGLALKRLMILITRCASLWSLWFKSNPIQNGSPQKKIKVAQTGELGLQIKNLGCTAIIGVLGHPVLFIDQGRARIYSIPYSNFRHL
jgi:hypothetical protein